LSSDWANSARASSRAALPPPQLAEPRDPVDERGAPAAPEYANRRRQLLFGLVPRPLLEQHRRVLGAADVEERAQLPALRELLHLVAPLRRALDVADALAGGDQVAADLGDPHQVADLACSGRGGRLVEPAHAFADFARLDEREAFERAPGDLYVLALGLRAELDRAERRLARGLGRSGLEGDLGFAHCQPAVLGRDRLFGEQPTRALEPALGDRRPPAEQQRVPGEGRRDSRCAERIAGLTIEPERALAGAERGVGVVEPPVRQPHALQRLGVVLAAAELLERVLPPAGRERLPAGCNVRHRRSISRAGPGVAGLVLRYTTRCEFVHIERRGS